MSLDKKSKHAAIYVDPKELRPWVKNPRKNNKAVNKVAESIKAYGFGSPILATENGQVISGHTRLKAAIALKLKLIPVRYVDLDEKKAKLLAIAENKLGEIAEWDDNALEQLLQEFTEEDLKIIGFEKDDKALDYSGALVEEIDGDNKPEFYVIFRGPLELQADLLQRLQALLIEFDQRIRLETGI